MAPSSARCSSSPRLSSSTIGEYCFRPFSEFSFITVYSGCTWHQSAPEGAVTFFSSHTGKHSLFFCVFHFRSQTWSNKKRIFIFLTQGKTSTYSREKHNKSPFFYQKKSTVLSRESTMLLTITCLSRSVSLTPQLVITHTSANQRGIAR